MIVYLTNGVHPSLPLTREVASPKAKTEGEKLPLSHAVRVTAPLTRGALELS